MKYVLMIILILLLFSCNKQKTLLICGDHVCVNKAEAKQFFEENLTLEVKIIDKKNKKEINLVELNLKETQSGTRQVMLSNRDSTKKDLKTLSNNQKKIIKDNIRQKKMEKKIANKTINKNEKKIIRDKIKDKGNTEVLIKEKNVNKIRKDDVDICNIIEKCSIDEIAKYLQKQNRNKNFPDITQRQQ